MCKGVFLSFLPCQLLDPTLIRSSAITLFLSLLLHFVLQHRYKNSLEKELEQYKQALSEQSEVFKHKLALFQNFFIQEYLPKKHPDADKDTIMLEYYGKIGLLGNMNTLKAIVDSKLTELEPNKDDIEQTYALLLSLRQELNSNLKNDPSILADYVKVLFQIFTPIPQFISEDRKVQTGTVHFINKEKISYTELGSLVALKMGTALKKLSKGDEFEYIRIKDINSFNNVQGEFYKLPLHSKAFDLENILLVSTIGTIGKLAFIRNKTNAIISGNLAFGKINPQIINPSFLDLIWQTDYVQSQLRLFYAGTVQKFIPLFSLKQITLPLLPIEDQNLLIKRAETEGKLIAIQDFNKVLPKFLSREELLASQIYDRYCNHPAIQNIQLSPINLFEGIDYVPDIFIELKNGQKIVIELVNVDIKRNDASRIKFFQLAPDLGYCMSFMYEYDLKSIQETINDFISD